MKKHNNLKLTDLIKPVATPKKKKFIIISESQAKRIFKINIDEEQKKSNGTQD
jgi:hypothetical protein